MGEGAQGPLAIEIPYRVVQKTDTLRFVRLNFINIDRFSNLFYCQNQQNICNNTVTEDSTAPQGVATLPCAMSVS